MIRTTPVAPFAVITHGSLFAPVRPRPSAPEPGGSDRSSGPDPLLTRHPPAERPGETFGPCGRTAGASGRPGGEDSETRGDRPPRHTPRNPCVESERRALMIEIRRTRLSCVWRGLLFATTLEVETFRARERRMSRETLARRGEARHRSDSSLAHSGRPRVAQRPRRLAGAVTLVFLAIRFRGGLGKSRGGPVQRTAVTVSWRRYRSTPRKAPWTVGNRNPMRLNQRRGGLSDLSRICSRRRCPGAESIRRD